MYTLVVKLKIRVQIVVVIIIIMLVVSIMLSKCIFIKIAVFKVNTKIVEIN